MDYDIDEMLNNEPSNVVGTLLGAAALAAFGGLAFYGAYKVGEKAGDAVVAHIKKKYPKKA